MRLSASFSALLVLASTACGGASSDAFDDEDTSGSTGTTTSGPTTGSTTSAGSTTSTTSVGTSTSEASSGSGLGGDDTGSGAGGASGTGGLGGAGEGGDGSGGEGPGPAGTGGEGVGGAGTGGSEGTGGEGGTGPTCEAADFEPTTEEATRFFGGTFYTGTEPAGGGLEDTLYVDLHGDHTEGDYTLLDENYSECETCVLLRYGCEQDSTICAQKFLARAGTVRIEKIDTDLVGELIDVELYEVTTSDGVSSPVPNGETRCIDSYAFEAAIIDI